MLKKKKYDDLFFDIDNTLVDFEDGSTRAFERVFTDLGLDYNESVYADYHKVNRRYWRAYEAGDIDNATLRGGRFEAFFKEYGYGSYDGHAFNDAYLQHLIVETQAVPGIKSLLVNLKQTHRIHAITNGFKEVQRPRLKRLGLIDIFDSITVSDEIGYAKPEKGYFDHAFNQTNPNPSKEKSLVIGDSLTSDIQGGNLYGVDTCWISNSRYNDAEHLPTHTLKSVMDIQEILA